MYLSWPVLPQKFIGAIYFFVTGVEKPKNAIWKKHVCIFTYLESRHSVKNKGIALKFGIRIIHTWFSHIYSGFLKILKIFDFVQNFPKKSVFWIFGGQNRKFSKMWDSHFVENLISYLLTFKNCILLHNWPVYALLKLGRFCRKSHV